MCEVTLVELKDIQLPDSMKRAMARQAEAEREKRAKIIAAEGESLAAAALGDASDTMMAHPLALQLRNLQSLVELGVDKNTTVVFPAPLMSAIGDIGALLRPRDRGRLDDTGSRRSRPHRPDRCRDQRGQPTEQAPLPSTRTILRCDADLPKVVIMSSKRFRQLVEAPGPFASIYFEDSHDTQNAAAQLDAKWRDLHRQLEDQGADVALISRVERAVVSARPPVGRSGRGIVAGAAGVLVNEHLISPPVATVVRVSELPYVVPLLESGIVHTTYVLAAVDRVGADITLYQGDTVRSDTVDAGGYPVHKAPESASTGYGDPQHRGEDQHRVEEAVRKNVCAVADRLTEVLDGSEAEAVFVVGQDRSRAELIADLPERVTARVVDLPVGARNTGVDDEVRHAIEAEFERRRIAVSREAAERFRAEGHGPASPSKVSLRCAALREGAVETLIIGDLGDETVVASDDLMTMAPNADVLSEHGAAPRRTLRADETLPFVAITVAH